MDLVANAPVLWQAKHAGLGCPYAVRFWCFLCVLSVVAQVILELVTLLLARSWHPRAAFL